MLLNYWFTAPLSGSAKNRLRKDRYCVRLGTKERFVLNFRIGIMADWEITKTLGECCGSGRKLEIGQEYFAALLETDEGFERRDFSVEFWEEQKPEVYCYWKTKMADPQQKKKIFINDEMLMSFFERLEEETEEEKVNFRFVLALVLMRKRKLKYDSSNDEFGKEIWTVKVTGENRTVRFINPHLTEEQIEQLSSLMGQILQVDM